MLLAFNDSFHHISSTIMVASIIYQAIFLIYQLIFKPAPYLRRLIRITFIIAIIVVFVPILFVEMII